MNLNLDLKVGNNAQQILPVPYVRQPTPSVPSGNNYGKAPYPMPIKPTSRVDDDLQYCNFLEPAPRDQRLNVPYEGKKNCKTFKDYNTQPFSKESCYLMDSVAQGTTGIVCNQAGGSDNSNTKRGNQFSIDYPDDQNLNSQDIEYIIEKPVQMDMALKNPLIIYDKSEFYPDKTLTLEKGKDYLTYPRENNYSKNGKPEYVYPYETANIELFTSDLDNNVSKGHAMLWILLILVLIVFIFY